MIQAIDNMQTSLKKLVINITGHDAGKFLQGQLTCDVLTLQDQQSTLGAYCNIKGKVESIFKLSKIADGYILDTNIDLIQATIQELKKYAVFSKVQIGTCEYAVNATNDKQEILSKTPTIYPATVGMFFPHDLNLPALGAVSFTKGCYRGQEIVARMQHRGNLKRSLYIFTAAAMVNHGDQIMAGATVAGTIVRSYFDAEAQQTLGLAVITDTLSNELLCTVNGVAITLQG